MERRLIDATELLDDLNSLNSTDYGSMGDYKAHRAAKEVLDDVYRVVTAAPTISAVEVVRCRECKHRKDPFVCPMCGECVAPEGEDWGVHDWAEDDGFCHKGERREPDENAP